MQGWIHRGLLGQYQQANNNACIIVWPNKPQSEGDWAQVEFTIKEQRMTIEKLAEMGHNAEREFSGGLVTEWSNVPDTYKKSKAEFARAIAIAVLADVTENENRCLTAAERIGANRVMNSRRIELTQSKQPAADASKADVSDDEVEMVAKAIYNEAAVNPVSVEGPYNKDPRHESSRNARWAARAALSAMNRGERWGVWSNEAWAVDRLTGKHITSCDKDVLRTLCRVWNENENYQWAAEVRPYPSTPQVQVPEEAVEAGARASYEADGNGKDWEKHTSKDYWRAKSARILTAALPHLQRGVTK